jgi:hypothetical protein
MSAENLPKGRPTGENPRSQNKFLEPFTSATRKKCCSVDKSSQSALVLRLNSPHFRWVSGGSLENSFYTVSKTTPCPTMLHNSPSTSDSQPLDLTPFSDQDENGNWGNALHQFDNNMLMSAVHEFQSLPQTSKVLFNCGVIFQLLERHKTAVWISKLRPVCLN